MSNEGSMSNELKSGQLSAEPVERKRKRSDGRHRLRKAASRTNGSHYQYDTSSNGTSVPKPEPKSLPTGIQKKNNGTITSDNKSVVEVDASTNTITANRSIFATHNQDSSQVLVSQVANLLLNAGKLDVKNVKWALNTICGMGPKDELEGLLAVQMIGVHSLAMECLRRASREGQTPDGIDANINHATKLLRTFTAQMEALNRHRGKIGQMVVGNVNVSDGGQAIVGQVSRDGQGAPTEDGKNSLE